MANHSNSGAMPRIHRRWVGGLLALLLASGTAQAQDLTLTEARLRLLPGDMPGAGYFSLHNGSDAPVTLVGADSEAFEHTELHMSMQEGDMASMQAVSRLEVAAGERLEFAPQGYHLMFMKRREPLEVGDDVEVVLEFEDGRQLPATFEVVSPVSMQ